VTERVWACVTLQWEWLGGTPTRRPPSAAVAQPTAREVTHAASGVALVKGRR
jgi:hypothetical protein